MNLKTINIKGKPYVEAMVSEVFAEVLDSFHDLHIRFALDVDSFKVH